MKQTEQDYVISKTEPLSDMVDKAQSIRQFMVFINRDVLFTDSKGGCTVHKFPLKGSYLQDSVYNNGIWY